MNQKQNKTDPSINQPIELQLERMSYGTRAIGRYHLPNSNDKIVVFVNEGCPGDHVLVKVTQKKSNYWEGDIEKIITPSKHRITPPCKHAREAGDKKCGGCQWQHLSYSEQIQNKNEILIHQVAKTTKILSDDLWPLLKSYPAQNEFAYRSRIQARGNSQSLGFYKAETHEIIPIDQCLIASPAIQSEWNKINTPETLKKLSAATGSFKIEWDATDPKNITTLLNRKHGAAGFSQVNQEQNQVLQSIVTSLVQKSSSKDLLLDLYGGNGNLSKALADSFKYTLCVDTHNNGCDPLLLNSKTPSGFHLIRQSSDAFLCEKRWLDLSTTNISCIIADPPRAGLESAAHLIKNSASPQVILVSCDPSTLSRDLSVLISEYQIKSIHMVDMFPQTYHLESVIELTRK